MDDRETGTVKKWNEKGFGFIERDGMGDSIFVHARNIADRQALIPGFKVSFIYEADEKGGKAKEVTVEEMAEAVVLDEGPRQMGTVKRRYADKGFGFLGPANGEADAFFHKKSIAGYVEPYVGQAVSFVFEEGPKGVAAVQVKEEEGGRVIEEPPVEDEKEREMGTVKICLIATRWNAEKGFGFIGRLSGEEDAFFHKKSFVGSNEPYVGQAVSFVFEEGPKGAAAAKVKEEGGDIAPVEEEGEREMGKVKTWSEEKGFAFIARCVDATEIFGHKREFPQDVEPYVGQPVSFVYEVTEKGGIAKKIREEDGVPDIPFSDEGCDFGAIKNFNVEKSFGFIVERKGGDEVRFFEKALNEIVPEKNTCVSFVREEGDKGPLAKVPVKKTQNAWRIYKDPLASKPVSGYGFIVELDQLNLTKPKKHYFHMWEIETPDDVGAIEPGTVVSFIIIPARKGFQAAAVTIIDSPKEKEADPDNEAPLERALDEMHVSETTEVAAGATGGDWGNGGW